MPVLGRHRARSSPLNNAFRSARNAPAWRSVQASPPSFPVYGQKPFGCLVPPADPDFRPSANRRCPESAGRRVREPEMRCNCRAGLQWLWENGRRFAAQSRRGRDVGVVLQESMEQCASRPEFKHSSTAEGLMHANNRGILNSSLLSLWLSRTLQVVHFAECCVHAAKC